MIAIFWVYIQFCAKEMQTKFGVFRSLFSRKFDEILPRKRSRTFVKSNEISLSSWQNFASTEAKFCFAEISSERKFATANFAIVTIRAREISPGRENLQLRNFHKAKFCWQWRRVVIKTFCSDRFKSLSRVIYVVL